MILMVVAFLLALLWLWGVKTDRIWAIFVGVLGGFAAVVASAYLPAPW